MSHDLVAGHANDANFVQYFQVEGLDDRAIVLVMSARLGSAQERLNMQWSSLQPHSSANMRRRATIPATSRAVRARTKQW